MRRYGPAWPYARKEETMIVESIKTEIINRLHKAEKEHNVTILLAIESGSRAWGFASPNSDYDVRFIYVHNRDWYLSVDLEERRDVIEYPIVDDIDLSGWDLRKALNLFRQSNPSLVEWLFSPITYIEKGTVRTEMIALLNGYYGTHKGIHHYANMAKSNYRSYLTGDRLVMKKYFYALRPILAVRWIEKYQEPAPIPFDTLCGMITDNDGIHSEVETLLARKAVSVEKEVIDQIPVLNSFIEKELERYAAMDIPVGGKAGVLDHLNTLFISVLERVSPFFCISSREI